MSLDNHLWLGLSRILHFCLMYCPSQVPRMIPFAKNRKKNWANDWKCSCIYETLLKIVITKRWYWLFSVYTTYTYPSASNIAFVNIMYKIISTASCQLVGQNIDVIMTKNPSYSYHRVYFITMPIFKWYIFTTKSFCWRRIILFV